MCHIKQLRLMKYQEQKVYKILLAKKAIHGNKIENLQALANPKSINFFKNFSKSNLLNE